MEHQGRRTLALVYFAAVANAPKLLICPHNDAIPIRQDGQSQRWIAFSGGEVMRLVHSAILIGLLLFVGSAHADICRVTVNGANDVDGSDWSVFAMSLPRALQVSTCSDIWVAAGVYRPDVPAGAGLPTTDDPADSFVINRNGVKLLGGFPAGGGSLADRNPAAHLTILSGDIDENDSNADGNQIAETTADIAGSNSYHILYLDGTTANGPIDSSTVIDGFVITAGQANGFESGDIDGGGLFCNGDGSNGGTGVSCNPTLSNLRFSGNQAFSSGGAIYNNGFIGASNPVITHVTFSGNSAGSGGAMYNYGYSSPVLTNVTFHSNSAATGGAMYNDAFLGDGNPVLRHVTFGGNHADYFGGAMYNSGHAGSSNPQLVSVVLWGDTANSGPEIFSNVATLAISHSVIQGGCAGIDGGLANCDNIITTDPLLGPLQNNGGFTDTLLPGNGSPTIDAGDVNACLTTSIDQRGVSRPQGDACDIGAVEVLSGCRVDDDSTAPGGGNGMDWPSAYQNLQDALEDPECQEIWVAAGVYKPAAAGNQGTSFLINRNGLRLYGGFAGTENSSAGRDPKANLTILSGDIDSNDDSNNADGNFINEASTDIVGSNSFHVLHVDGSSVNGPIDGSTVIDGFVITGGQASGSFPDNAGGGLYCNGTGPGKSCSPTLKRLTFSGNNAASGGAIYNRGSASGNSSPLLSDVAFHGNSASNGGAMYNDGYSSGTSSPDLHKVTFSDNSATSNGGAMHNYGYFGGSSPMLTNATFSGNHAATYGGAIYSDASSGNSSPTLVNATFNGNSAGAGGALYNYGPSGTSNAQLANVILWGDSASNGSEVFNSGTTTSTINDSVLQGGCAAVGGNAATCNNLFTTDPLLGPLQANGGFTATMHPGLGGSAVDNGTDINCPDTDQRDVARPQGPHCDIGAVELTLEIFANGFQ